MVGGTQRGRQPDVLKYMQWVKKGPKDPIDRRERQNIAKLTFPAVALNVVLAGNEMGNSGSDLAGVGTAIAFYQVRNGTYSLTSSVHLTQFCLFSAFQAIAYSLTHGMRNTAGI